MSLILSSATYRVLDVRLSKQEQREPTNLEHRFLTPTSFLPDVVRSAPRPLAVEGLKTVYDPDTGESVDYIREGS